jgi:glycosyltransferase involved in cell wall biosynthesis
VGQALRGATAVTVSGSHNRALIKQVGYNIPDSKIYTVVLGVDTDLFTPADVPRESNRLLHVGSLVDIKDQATLLWALWGLDESVQLDIIGDGPLRPALERLAEELRISHRVNFLGSVPHQMVVDHYRRAALHVMSSRNEAVPMTTIEAAACGLPTVSTAVGMLVDHPSMGVTVPVGDDTALAAAITELLADEPRRLALSHSAETARDQFSLHHTAQRFREAYATVI